jgi:hypothetical protein
MPLEHCVATYKISRLSIVKLHFVCVVAHDLSFGDGRPP